MDFPSRLLTYLEDLREAPEQKRVAAELRRRARDLRSVGFVIREQAERYPEREFLRFERRTLTFEAFNDGVNRYAHVLRQAGIERGDVVAIMMENSPEFLMLEGAVGKIGAVGALINTALRGAALEHVLGASGAALVVADRACGAALLELPRAARRRLLIEGAAAEEAAEDLRQLWAAAPGREVDIADVGFGDVFLYVYTSGTTGYPKPAIVRHARFSFGGCSLIAVLGLEQGDCSYAPTPLYHGYSNFVGFAPALHNASAFASRSRFSARHFLDDVIRARATHFMYVGELCRYLLNQPPGPLDRAHRIRVASGPGLRPDVWRRFTERFAIDRVLETYGQTEANVSLMNRRGRVGSVGRAAPGTHRQLRLVRFDPLRQQPLRNARGRLEECAVGEVGELVSVVADDTRMSFDGYVDRAENESKLLRDCFEEGDVYLRTGDLMRRDRASYYYFVDRIGDTFRWKGENVATAEVAELLNGAPGVVETAVYGVAVPGNEGRAGMALVVLAEGAELDGVAYYRHASRTLPGYARPLFVRVSDRMDVTGTLKHSKLRLQEEGFDLSRVGEPLYFRDDRTERYVELTPQLAAEIAAGGRRL